MTNCLPWCPYPEGVVRGPLESTRDMAKDKPQSGAEGGVSTDLATLIGLRREARQLHVAPRGKVLATLSGGHMSRFRGRGMEFDESRVYQPGDDPRNMDWRVTARSGQAHVKLFREERERPVWLLVDAGPGMRFGTRVAFKSVIAARAAALLAWAAADKGDRVGGLVFDESRRFERRPLARTRGVLPLLNALSDDAPAGSAGDGFGSLNEAGEHLVHLVRPGALVFVHSDFAGVKTGNAAWLARLVHGSEVVLLHIYDPLEAAAPPPGRYPVSDGSERGVLDTSSQVLREGWHDRFAAHVATLEKLSRLYSLHLISLRTDEPVGEALQRGLQPRRLRTGAVA